MISSTLHRWELVDFRQRSEAAEVGETWTSPSFLLNGVPGTEAHLFFEPKHRMYPPFEEDDEEMGEEAAWSRYGVASDQPNDLPDVRVPLKVWIENADGKPIGRYLGATDWQFIGLVHACEGDMLSTLQDHAAGWHLYVCCEIGREEGVEDALTRTKEDDVKLRVLENVGQMLWDNEFADFEVHVGERVFRVHKFVLISQSAYFKSVFRHNPEVPRKGMLEEKEFHPEIMQKVFEFMYTGKVEGLEPSARDLLRAADFYQLEPFQELCVAAILRTLSVEKILDDLRLAVTLNHFEDFKSQLLHFAKQNAKNIYELPGFTEEFISQNPALAKELFKSITH